MPDPIHIPGFGWRPALEILILAVLIYFVFKFVRGTRGWPVVIGFVVVLLALTVVTTILNLQVLRWILGSASVFIAIGAVVIFQPELRRMLAELGNLPLFASTSEQRESHRGHHPDLRAAGRREDRRAHRHRAVHPVSGGRRVRHQGGLRRDAGNAGNDFLPEQRHSRRRRDFEGRPHRLRRVHFSADAAAGI